MFRHLLMFLMASGASLKGASFAVSKAILGLIPISLFRPGGNSSALNVTAAAVIKVSSGVIMRVIVVATGSGGSLTINDNTQTGGTNVAANQIITIAQASLTVGQVLTLEVPCTNGIVVSAVPTGGSQFTITYN